MFVRVEPKGLSMFSVYFIFNRESPDSADEEIKAYLREHHLEPKREADTEYEGADRHVMYFGSCYIQRHMKEIQELNRKGLERDLLAREIEHVVALKPSGEIRSSAAALSPEPMTEIKAALLERFSVDSSFGIENGYLVLQVEEAQIQEEFLKLAGAAAGR